MIILDYRDKRPIYEQVRDKISELIICGALAPGSKMPSVRTLALELSVNANTVQRAYQELEANGYLYSVLGRGNFVSETSSWQNGKKLSLSKELTALFKDAKNLGMAKEEIEKLLMTIYK